MEIALPPVHPLVVHLAVVLLPLVALGAIVIVLSRRARRRYGSLLAVGAVVAAAATLGARFSGEALAGTTTAGGTLGAHMFWGLIVPWPAVALAISVIGFLLTSRGGGAPRTPPAPDGGPPAGNAHRSARTASADEGAPGPRFGGPVQTTLGVLTVVLALASLAVVIVTGHLGATAVWLG